MDAFEESEADDRQNEQDRLYELREAHLQSLYQDIEAISDDDHFYIMSLSDLKSRQSRMKMDFREMEKAHHAYRQLTIVATNDILSSTQEILLEAFAKMQPRIQVLTETAQSRPNSPVPQSSFGQFANSTMANSTINPDGQAIIRVEQPHRPKIGQFNGSMADWPAFRDLFIAEVHNRPIDPVRKLLLLKEACIGKAAETLGTWQPTASNYQLAWDALMAAYNDEYHIIHGILAKLNSTCKQEEETHDALRAVLDSLNSCTRQLQAVTTPAVLTDQIWINHGKQRLPNTTLDAWEQHRNQHCAGRLPTLDDFKQFLDSKAKARREYENQSPLERHEHNRGLKFEAKDSRSKGGLQQSRGKPYDRNAKHPPTSSAPSEPRYGFAPPSTCTMPGCGQVHYLGQCRQFSSLTLSERLQLVKDKSLCKCCLAPGHMAMKCQRTGCSQCPNERLNITSVCAQRQLATRQRRHPMSSHTLNDNYPDWQPRKPMANRGSRW